MDLTEAVWRKSSRSTNNGGDCVEVASFSSAVAVRDSKDPSGPMLLVSRRAFVALMGDLKE
ncbi:DUF397 domain-containing protein [Actinomadura darangshiensis]|uniref:DUF397 domain-containing protein n=1 Tax=Actinomadura darangshiensis TaxID=705336 RepID=A0A4R5BII0_9ACTN|nr:DUF397 domain-containing protein [Actinomadura darangshiensis]TDD85349.1 DUF397 domain-containing protein [Actinomadura darangshiensis]